MCNFVKCTIIYHRVLYPPQSGVTSYDIKSQCKEKVLFLSHIYLNEFLVVFQFPSTPRSPKQEIQIQIFKSILKIFIAKSSTYKAGKLLKVTKQYLHYTKLGLPWRLNWNRQEIWFFLGCTNKQPRNVYYLAVR